MKTKALEHIAIIMDGNGRWGKKHYNNRTSGHKQGVVTLDKIIKHCINRNIKILTVYAFSTENWSRPKLEVNFLMNLFYKYLENKRKILKENNIKLNICGNKENLSKELIGKINEVCDELKHNTNFTLNICFNYGSRQEIVHAVNKLLSEKKEKITEEEFSNYLIPEPDLLIRTGGDTRISNFLLWQLAYTELYFTNTLWPDFDENCLDEAIYSYNNRERKFGGLNE